MNKYFTVEPVYKKVSKDEYQKFIDEYPRKLVRDVYGVCDPPSITYNDFELADRYPYSVVASTFVYDDEPGAYYYEPLMDGLDYWEEPKNYPAVIAVFSKDYYSMGYIIDKDRAKYFEELLEDIYAYLYKIRELQTSHF